MILGLLFMVIGIVLVFCAAARAHIEDSTPDLPAVELLPLDEL